MKSLLPRLLVTLFATGLCSGLLAQDDHSYAQVSLCGQGGSKAPTAKSEYITMVVDGPVLTYEASPIRESDVVPYVNKLLQEKKVSYIGVYIREGTKYGDVIHAVDTLRKTTAKNIGVSMSILPVGREP